MQERTAAGSSREQPDLGSRLRVAMVAPPTISVANGVFTAAVGYATGLARRGHRVELWQTRPFDRRAFAHHLERLAADGVETVQLSWSATHWLEPSALRSALARSVDVVHLHSVFNPSNTELASALNVPFVLSPHGGYAPASLRRGRLKKQLYLGLFDRRTLRRAAAICAITAAEREDLGRLGISTPIRIVPQGVDPPPEVDEEVFRKSLGISGRIALFCGRLDIFHKGLDRLIDEFAATEGWTLVLVGPGERGSTAVLRRRVAQRGLSDRVVFTGELRGLPLHEALAGADVLLLLSRWEAFPIALLEAFGHGTPAVISPEVERHVRVAAQGAAWVSAEGRLAETLAEVAARPEEVAHRQEAARQLARHHQWEETAAELERVYRSVLRVA